MDLFGAAHDKGRGEGGKGRVIPYLEKVQKIYKKHVKDPDLDFCSFQQFFTENLQFLLYEVMQI